jgi:hypothetical protein
VCRREILEGAGAVPWKVASCSSLDPAGRTPPAPPTVSVQNWSSCLVKTAITHHHSQTCLFDDAACSQGGEEAGINVVTRRSGGHTRNCAVAGSEVNTCQLLPVVSSTLPPRRFLEEHVSFQTLDSLAEPEGLRGQKVNADGTYNYHYMEASAFLPICRHVATSLLQHKAAYVCQGQSLCFRKSFPTI